MFWQQLSPLQSSPPAQDGPSGPCRAEHTASRHSSLLHVLPQPPQWLGSVVMSTQAPAQKVKPGWQTHTPESQDCPTPQAIPQPPQWSLSVHRSTQLCPQLYSPSEQTGMQDPAEQ
jgi:hypothetical protein